MPEYVNPRSKITFLVWSEKLSGKTTLEIMLKNLPFDETKRELDISIPSQDSQDFYSKYGLRTPDAELVLLSKNNEAPVPLQESMGIYWMLTQDRKLSVLSYVLSEEGDKIPENISPDLRSKVH